MSARKPQLETDLAFQKAVELQETKFVYKYFYKL